MTLYTEKDFVDVVDEVTGEPKGSIPKSWLGTDFGAGLKKAGKAVAPASTEPVTIPDGDPTDEWKVAEIDAYVERESIDVGGATKKDDKLAAIASALEKRKPEQVNGL